MRATPRQREQFSLHRRSYRRLSISIFLNADKKGNVAALSRAWKLPARGSNCRGLHASRARCLRSHASLNHEYHRPRDFTNLHLRFLFLVFFFFFLFSALSFARTTECVLCSRATFAKAPEGFFFSAFAGQSQISATFLSSVDFPRDDTWFVANGGRVEDRSSVTRGK